MITDVSSNQVATYAGGRATKRGRGPLSSTGRHRSREFPVREAMGRHDSHECQKIIESVETGTGEPVSPSQPQAHQPGCDGSAAWSFGTTGHDTTGRVSISISDQEQGEPLERKPDPAPAVWVTNSGTDYVLRLYLRDLAQASSAAPSEPHTGELGERLGGPARERLVLEHLPRVVRIAFDYQGFGLPLGDLISEGNLGLMRAAELYDPGRNVRFSYYARPWIRVQMQRALSYQAWPVSLPADFTWRHTQVQVAQERLRAACRREPDDTELASACRLEVPAVQRLRSTPTLSFVPLESPWPRNETGLTLAEVLPDDDAPVPDREAADHSDREFVERLVATLPHAEQQVIRLRYGLEDGIGRTLEEVGRFLGCSRQAVHRIESTALGKLRQHVRRLLAAGATA